MRGELLDNINVMQICRKIKEEASRATAMSSEDVQNASEQELEPLGFDVRQSTP